MKLRQVAYDIEATVRAVQGTDLPPQAKSMLADVYREGRYVHPNGLPLPPGNGFHIKPLARSA